MRQALHFHADIDHSATRKLNRFRVRRVQHEHGRSITGAETLLSHLAQQIAHVHGDISEINLDGTWC